MSGFYEEYWKGRGLSGSRPRYKIFAKWIEPDTSVLDAGCGDGHLGEMLVTTKHVKYQGCDISEQAIKVAKGRGLDVSIMDVEHDLASLSSNSFDYVIMSEFIEHIVHSEDVLVQAMRIARKGVLISIPNTAYWRFRLQLLLGNAPRQWAIMPYEHVRFWSISDFQKMIRGLGFRIRSLQASNGKIYLRDIWPNLFGLTICYYIVMP